MAQRPWEQETTDEDTDADAVDAAAHDLKLIGYVGLADTARPSSRPLIEALVDAERNVVLITGDHPVTARAIARQLGLPSDVRVVTGAELIGLDEDASAKLVADLLETAGASRALTLDLHAPQIQGYFDVPVDHLYGSPVLIDYFRHKKLANLTVVSPDAGGVERARAFAKKLDAPLAIVDKRRVDLDVTEVMNLIGDVKGRTTLIVDDIIDTAGTLVKTADALIREGATQVYAACTHAVFSGPAVERLEGSKITEVVATDSVPLS